MNRQRISEHDLWEIVKFKEYLADKQTMEPAEFYRKYQEYMGISDKERALLVGREKKP